jgi:hypothetical protein
LKDGDRLRIDFMAAVSTSSWTKAELDEASQGVEAHAKA